MNVKKRLKHNSRAPALGSSRPSTLQRPLSEPGALPCAQVADLQQHNARFYLSISLSPTSLRLCVDPAKATARARRDTACAAAGWRIPFLVPRRAPAARQTLGAHGRRLPVLNGLRIPRIPVGTLSPWPACRPRPTVVGTKPSATTAQRRPVAEGRAEQGAAVT